MSIEHKDLTDILFDIPEANIKAVDLMEEAGFDWETSRPVHSLDDNQLALVLDSFLTYTEEGEALAHKLQRLPPVPLEAGPLAALILL